MSMRQRWTDLLNRLSSPWRWRVSEPVHGLGHGLLALLFACLALPALALDDSRWIQNLSAEADPDGLYFHQQVRLAVSGNYVHAVWIGVKKDYSGPKVLFYRRSSNGGRSFEPPQAITHPEDASDWPSYDDTWNNLVVSGPYVHLFFRLESPQRLIYLRSEDNGDNFTPQTFVNDPYAFINGVYATAEGSDLAVAWASNNDNGGWPRGVYCAHSGDAGITFNTNTMIYDDLGDGSVIWRYGIRDMVRSGPYVYILGYWQNDNWFSSQSSLWLWGSTDNCQTVKNPVKVNLQASDGGYYAPRIQDANYSPNLAAKGPQVQVTWVNIDNPGGFDGWQALTLRTRRSIDAATTLSNPVTLYTYPAGYHHGAVPGQETVARVGNSLFISTITSENDVGNFVWRSLDAGKTWDPGQKILPGGWWPQLGVSAKQPKRVQAVNHWFHKSGDAGASFDGGITPQYDHGSWTSPQFRMDEKGVGHYAASSDFAGDKHIQYRRLGPEPAPAAVNQAVRLDKQAGSPSLPDYLQVPATAELNFGDAMTVEFWVKRSSSVPGYFENLLSKSRFNGDGSYEVGAWGDFQIYSRLVTEEAPSQYYGYWLGTGVTLAPRWMHVAMTYDNLAATDNWRIYVNGNLRAKTTVHGKIVTDNAPLLLGDKNLGESVAGAVRVDELRLWSRARTGAEIRADMHRPLTGGEPGLVAYYPFDKTFKDLSGHGHDAYPKHRETFDAGVTLTP